MKKIFFKFQIIALLNLTFISCNNQEKNKSTSDSNYISKVNDTNKQVINNNFTVPEKEDFFYPDNDSLKTEILQEGSYHNDEISKDCDKKIWYGLFKNNNGFYLTETKIELSKVHDEILDEKEADKTGWNVKALNTDSCFILIEKLSYLKPHSVDFLKILKNSIYTNDSIYLKYKGNDYWLNATVSNTNETDLQNSNNLQDYKLFVTTTINNFKYKNLLVAAPRFDDKMIEILFIGDIDNDGILDFIIDTANHYNVSSPTIYLSKPANKGTLVIPIGCITSVGC